MGEVGNDTVEPDGLDEYTDSERDASPTDRRQGHWDRGRNPPRALGDLPN